MHRRAVLVALPTIFLSGCERGAEVQVGGDPERPTFTFQRSGPHLVRRIPFPGELAVRGELNQDWELLWWAAADFGTRQPLVDRVVYGVPPPGTHTNLPAPAPLRPGRLHTVGVSGDGYIGGAVFAIIGGRIEVLHGTGDEAIRRMRARLAA